MSGVRPALFVAIACACGTTPVLDLLPLGDGGEAGTASDAMTDAATDGGCTQNGCPCGLTACDGGCFDLANDPSHCGSCTQGCPHDAYCNQMACACLPGFHACGLSCPDLASDPNQCGGCGATPCTAGQKCELGACGTGACTGGRTACDAGGVTACVDLTTSVPYCGACGVLCAPDEVCAGSKCARYVPATPCTQCPCAAECNAVTGTPTCCPGVAGGATPICVASSVCP